MKIGGSIGYAPGTLYRRSSKIGYTSGTLHKRHGNIGYAPGSKYKRFGGLGTMGQRNLSAMNRQAIDSYRSAVADSGSIVFATKYIESEGYSELAAHRVLDRVKQAANELVKKSESLSLSNGGNGGTSDGTGNEVDETV